MIIYEMERVKPTGGIYHQHNINLLFYKHMHNSFELIYVYEGILQCEVNGIPYVIHAGEAILILPNQVHYTSYISTFDKNKTYLCIFENNLVEEFYCIVKNSYVKSPVFTIPDPSIIDRIANFSGSRYLLKSYLYCIIDLFTNQCGAYLPGNNTNPQLIEAVLVYIASHFTEDISMKSIAENIGYDYHYLSALLKKTMNTTFRSLLNEYRISHAMELLTATDEAITLISYQCGYDSLCSFNRNFKEITGITPSAYRNTNK